MTWAAATTRPQANVTERSSPTIGSIVPSLVSGAGPAGPGGKDHPLPAKITRRGRSLARDDGEHPHDVLAEPLHEITEERSRGVVVDLAVLAEDAGPEMDVRLRRGHLPRVAERHHRTQ